MQNYKESPETNGKSAEVSGYMLLKLNLYQVGLMSKFGLSVDDARYVQMYEEYLSLLGEGVPKERIYQHFRGKYHVSESTVKRVVKRLSQRFTP